MSSSRMGMGYEGSPPSVTKPPSSESSSEAFNWLSSSSSDDSSKTSPRARSGMRDDAASVSLSSSLPSLVSSR